ncbi:MAG: CHASE3 domain-containing protein [Alphaproteobacteria bacterium]|nr:CHASE3 domain-containing protein [Alphaproteobacteria bacterium]
MFDGSLRIGTKFGAAFVAIIAIFPSISAVTYYSLKNIEEIDAWNTHTYEVLGQANILIGSVVNQETGVRGFLVSGDDNFLEPYLGGKESFRNALNQLLSLTSENPAQQERLRRIERFEQDWRTTIAEREISLMRNQATREQARAL